MTKEQRGLSVYKNTRDRVNSKKRELKYVMDTDEWTTDKLINYLLDVEEKCSENGQPTAKDLKEIREETLDVSRREDDE